MDDDVIQPAAREPRQCANCRITGHTLRRCMGPLTRDGTIPGCPFCETVDHELRTCPNLRKWTRRQAWNYLVKFRQGRPSFNIPWLLWELAPSFEMFLSAATDGKLPQSGFFANGRYREFGIQKFDHVAPDPTWTTLMRPYQSDWLHPQAWHRKFGNFSMRPGESPLSAQQSFGEKGAPTLRRKLAKQNQASGGNRGGHRGGAQSGSMSQAPVFYPPPRAPVSYGDSMQAGSQVGYFPQQTPVSYGPPMQAGGQVGFFPQQTPVSYGDSMQAGGQVGGFPQQTPVSYGPPMQAGGQVGFFPQQASVQSGAPSQALNPAFSNHLVMAMERVVEKQMYEANIAVYKKLSPSPPQASVQSGAPGQGLNPVFSNHLVMAMERVIKEQLYEANIAVNNMPNSSLSQSYRDRDDGSSHQGNSSQQRRRSQSPRGDGSAREGGNTS